ncbi:uncharacterized protein LOC124357164 [Homalodisca vitripennis]|uniref:uncharacterized protein LOC124357164 n=1 Tax=Homalodisca vitripennis TaxID=197043 RepID=UPI001EEBB171|nr:uncharacterized protein LOC124357164 [Homalodisca vitripennis]
MYVKVCIVILALVTMLCECVSALNQNKFVGIRNKLNFVDKTLLIREILKHRIVFISAPKGFGKSTNLEMIGLFLSNRHKKSEIAIHFKETKISDEKEFVKAHLGEYPVIQCDLLAESDFTSFESVLASFKESLHSAFVEHRYLLKSEKIPKEMKTILKQYTNLTDILQANSTEEVVEGLDFLSEILHKHYAKPVVLLVNGFGQAVTENIIQKSEDVTSILNLYSLMIRTTFVNSSTISHVVLSGETWLYGLKGTPLTLIDYAGFLQRPEFSLFYGFTHNEADDLMRRFKVQGDQREEAYKWFGGYSSLDGKVQVFNPTSLLKFLQYKHLKKYWIGSQLGTDLIELMLHELNFKNNFTNLVTNGSYSVKINLEKDMRLVCLENLKNKITQIPEHCGNFFYRVLLEAGYLTFMDNQGKDKKNVALALPNEEIRSYFNRYISKFNVVQWHNESFVNLEQILSKT